MPTEESKGVHPAPANSGFDEIFARLRDNLVATMQVQGIPEHRWMDDEPGFERNDLEEISSRVMSPDMASTDEVAMVLKQKGELSDLIQQPGVLSKYSQSDAMGNLSINVMPADDVIGIDIKDERVDRAYKLGNSIIRHILRRDTHVMFDNETNTFSLHMDFDQGRERGIDNQRKKSKYIRKNIPYSQMSKDDSVILGHYLEEAVKHLSGQVVYTKPVQPQETLPRKKRFGIF